MRRRRYVLLFLTPFLFSSLLAAQTTKTKKSASPAKDVDPLALDVLRAVAEPVEQAQTFSFKAIVSEEQLATDGQLITFFHTVDITVQRPDKIRLTLRGRGKTVEFYMMNGSVTLFAPDANLYAVMPAKSSIEASLANLEDKDVDLPIGPFLRTDFYDRAAKVVTTGYVIGRVKINDQEVHQLAFTSPDADWQVWVTGGPTPRFVRVEIVISKTLEGKPRTIIQFLGLEPEFSVSRPMSSPLPSPRTLTRSRSCLSWGESDMKFYIASALCASLAISSAQAQVGKRGSGGGGGGGGARVNTQNRSAPNNAGGNRAASGNQGANGNRGANSTQNTNRSAANNANANRNTNANRSANVNNNTNVNRNVNVNQNVNVNRNVNVNSNYHGGGCYNCGYNNDNDWNWGAFAAGAAVGVATTAAVAAANRPATVVVAPPALGTMVPALPGGCGEINTGNAMVYNCSSVYYRPYYQGTTLVYQVVTYP